ncbi:sporulation protein YtxC [Gracilibacillus dipsosauri]|uniref:Sporulation protein YtxC n=1 Tax=Gracilibacillus dipsosauri TaxID=178340 RepID=A0A317KZH4_9BACI|nr:sporulation protein YtxC [Gracilibacillus dipsosauri]PWU68190.1 hypothetical protein DLJ74_06955 [Gracilibacillus dipsosauri]
MLEVYFEQEQEADVFYQLAREETETQLKAIRRRGNRNSIFILQVESVDMDIKKKTLAKLLSNVYITCREIPQIRTILEKKYHFSNKEEIERITSIAHSLLEKDEDIYEDKIHQHELRDILMAIFLLHLEPDVIRFDSIVHFRLHHYLEQLTEIVGLAIDEFKREEEYQSFINSIREFVHRKQAEEDVIFVLAGEQYQFYREDGTCLTKEMLEELMNHFPLFIFGMQENEWNISPLLMLAPKHLFLYTEDPNDAQINTILNIFQEKCSLFPSDAFPFFDAEEKES